MKGGINYAYPKIYNGKHLEISYPEGSEESILWGKGRRVELSWNHLLLFWCCSLKRRNIPAQRLLI